MPYWRVAWGENDSPGEGPVSDRSSWADPPRPAAARSGEACRNLGQRGAGRMWGRPPGVYLLWLVMLCMTVGEIFRIPATAVGGSHGQEDE
jgi:hypothetical protein